MRFDVPDWDAVVAAIHDASTIGLAPHVNPDGDAVGSLFAAALGLKKLGKRVYPTLAEAPAEVPVAFSFLPGTELLVQPQDVLETDVFLALDCGGVDRLGDAVGAARRAAHLVNIDHHPGNDCFGDLNVVVPRASSTAELVTYLLTDAGVELDPNIGTCLYTGVVTDTGRFQYSNATPDTLRLAADLLALGVPATRVAQEVYESSPFGYLKLIGRVLERATLHQDDRFVYSWIDQRDLAETGVAYSETDTLIDLIRSTRAADVAAMFKEQEDGSWRVSLRSKGPRTVASIARANGGGGHELAAGFTAPGRDHGIERVLAGLRG